MISSFLYSFLLLLTATIIRAQQSSADSGYIGYSLTQDGDPNSAVYDTSSTPANVSTTYPPPDVYLNASVHVGEIDLTVSNLTAKINLDAQVLQLLQFNAGVDASIDRVSLLIQNVSANVQLEARLANLVLMIDDVLHSLDLNPILATIGSDVGQLVNSTVGGLSSSSSASSASSTGGSTSTVSARSYNLDHNILYSINNYQGHTHTNRVLTQSGSIVDQSLDDNGHITGEKTVGNYLSDMSFNGYELDVTKNGKAVKEREYVYEPFPGLSVVSAVYVDGEGSVLGTLVLVESSGGGSSTVGRS